MGCCFSFFKKTTEKVVIVDYVHSIPDLQSQYVNTKAVFRDVDLHEKY